MPAAGKMNSEKRAWVALLALFALMVQALVPAAAMAAARPGDPATMVICTQDGAKIVPTGAPAHKPKGFAGMPCQDCLAAAMAAIAPPSLALQPVVYQAARVEPAEIRRLDAPRARAPPRPPGQGPPAPTV
jgi:Na+/proline symporter